MVKVFHSYESKTFIAKLTFIPVKLRNKTSFGKCNAPWFQKFADLSEHVWKKNATIWMKMGMFL